MIRRGLLQGTRHRYRLHHTVQFCTKPKVYTFSAAAASWVDRQGLRTDVTTLLVGVA